MRYLSHNRVLSLEVHNPLRKTVLCIFIQIINLACKQLGRQLQCGQCPGTFTACKQMIGTTCKTTIGRSTLPPTSSPLTRTLVHAPQAWERKYPKLLYSNSHSPPMHFRTPLTNLFRQITAQTGSLRTSSLPQWHFPSHPLPKSPEPSFLTQ